MFIVFIMNSFSPRNIAYTYTITFYNTVYILKNVIILTSISNNKILKIEMYMKLLILNITAC